MTANSDWYCEFEDLPKHDGNGKVITYSISEDAVRSYRTSITDNGNGSFTVKNFHSRGPATGDESNPVLWAVIGAAALAGLIGTGVALGKKRKKETPEKNK